MLLGIRDTWFSSHIFLSSGHAFEAPTGVLFLEFTFVALFPSLLRRLTALSRVVIDSSLGPSS